MTLKKTFITLHIFFHVVSWHSIWYPFNSDLIQLPCCAPNPCDPFVLALNFSIETVLGRLPLKGDMQGDVDLFLLSIDASFVLNVWYPLRPVHGIEDALRDSSKCHEWFDYKVQSYHCVGDCSNKPPNS